VISATNRDLMTEIKAGRFREDLFYRLNVLRIHVAPLRERRDDIPALLDHYLQEYSRRHGTGRRELSPDVVARLSEHDWPGNVRQLKNIVERMVVKSTGPTIELRDLPRDAEFSGPPRSTETAAARSLVDRSVVPN